MTIRSVANTLLDSLPEAERVWLLEHLHAVDLKRGQVLIEAGQPLARFLFVTRGCVIASTATDRARVAVACIGREGLIGASMALGVLQSPHTFEVSVAGSALELLEAEWRAAEIELPALRAAFLRYNHDLILQISETAAVTARFMLRARLARHLTMLFNRTGMSELSLTHDDLCRALCVRRPGVTVALHELEGEHLIIAKRCSIQLRDAEKLALAGMGEQAASGTTPVMALKKADVNEIKPRALDAQPNARRVDLTPSRPAASAA